MRRRLVGFAIALGLIVAGFTATSMPVAAATCAAGDHDTWVWNAPYNTVRIHAHLHVYAQAVIDPRTGQLTSCNFAYLAYAYAENGGTMNASPIWLRVWRCGTLWDGNSQNYTGATQPQMGLPVSGYYNYPLGCNPQADTAYSYPGPPGYATSHIWGYGSPNWHANGWYVSW